MRVHYLMHVAHEALGNMEQWFVERDYPITRTRLYAGEALPDPQAVDWLVVMGGPMGVYEEDTYPWLRPEKQFIREVIERNVPVLGVCLGAQLIAEVLGGVVTRNRHQEIGWFPVELTEAAVASSLFRHLPAQFTPLHWHGDTFSLPPGAQHIVRSAGCDNQAFVFGERVVGLQFHLETLPSVAQAFCDEDAALLKPATYVQTPQDIMSEARRFSAMLPWMHGLLDALAARA